MQHGAQDFLLKERLDDYVLPKTLAAAIDRAGREHEMLFLSKLALLLGNELRDAARMEQLIEIALRDLT